jgi:hypothetical protein
VIAAWVFGAAACGLDLRGLEQAPGDASTRPDGATVDAFVGVDAPPDTQGGSDATVSDGADAGGAGEGGIDGGGIDAPADVVNPPEAAVDACSPSGPESCSNGLDDDCNGLVDCADPACASTGFTCAQAVPPGWTLVAYDRASRGGCPGGWGSSSPTVEGPDGGAACGCACGTYQGNPCLIGSLSLSLGQTQCGCSQTQNIALVSDGGCDPIAHAIGQPCGTWGDGKVAALAPVSLACSEVRTLPPIGFAAQGQTCVPTAGIGAGCSSGGGCVPSPAPAAGCIQTDGAQASCPPGFSTLSIVYSPADVADGRQCQACGCVSAATTCTGASVTLYDDSNCTTGDIAVPADGKCDDVTGDPSDAGWFVYRATPDTTACQGPSTSPITGGVVAGNPKTICCP